MVWRMKKIGYLPQYAAARLTRFLAQNKKEHSRSDVCGNMGAARSLTTVLQAAELPRETTLRWQHCGRRL